MTAKGLNKTQRDTLDSVAQGHVYLQYTKIYGASPATVRVLVTRGLIARGPADSKNREVYTVIAAS